MPAKNNVLKQLSKAYLVVDQTATPGNTTLTAGALAGATALTVAGITNFANGDLIRVGAGEEIELAIVSGTPAGNTVNIATGLVYDHVSGEQVVEQVAYDLGDVEAGGVNLAFAGESQDINVATKRLAFTTLNGYVDASVEFQLPTFTLANFALATGIAQSTIRGTGTAADPLELTTDGNEFAGVTNASIVVVGQKYDGTYLRAELWGVDFDYTGISFALSRGQLTAVPVRAVASAGGILASSNVAFTASTALLATRGKAWDYLSEVGLFVDTATTTTVNGNVAAGATSLTMTSGTSFAEGEWVRIGTGDQAQFIWLGTKSTNTFTLRTRPFRAIATGATITKVTPTKFAGTSPEGVNVAVGGSVEPLRIAERRLSIGLRAGAATVSVGFTAIDLSLANIARALGIPQSAVAGGRLPFNNNIGTSQVDGLYVKGVLQDGTIAWVVASGNAIDVANVALQMTNSGGTGGVPITAKPASYLQLLQHA